MRVVLFTLHWLDRDKAIQDCNRENPGHVSVSERDFKITTAVTSLEIHLQGQFVLYITS